LACLHHWSQHTTQLLSRIISLLTTGLIGRVLARPDAAQLHTSGLGHLQASLSPLADTTTLELSERSHLMNEQLSFRSGWIHIREISEQQATETIPLGFFRWACYRSGIRGFRSRIQLTGISRWGHIHSIGVSGLERSPIARGSHHHNRALLRSSTISLSIC
jgi:hypothetical protein